MARGCCCGDIAAQYLAAARDGKRIHDALQQAIKLDPSLGDAYFGLGLYHYYAAIAPRAARILSALLFLPGGDRAGGLKEMEQTRSKGMLLRGEADYQLHLIYLWYERQPTTALRLDRGPAQPLSAQSGVLSAGSRTCRATTFAITQRRSARIERCSTPRARGRVAAPAISEVQRAARHGAARLDALLRHDRRDRAVATP